jgi:hypothetical protein
MILEIIFAKRADRWRLLNETRNAVVLFDVNQALVRSMVLLVSFVEHTCKFTRLRMNAMVLKSEASILDQRHVTVAHANGKMKRKAYERKLQKLQLELCRLQDWVKETGERIIILFEGSRRSGQAWNDQGDYRARQPESFSRCGASHAFGP